MQSDWGQRQATRQAVRSRSNSAAVEAQWRAPTFPDSIRLEGQGGDGGAATLGALILGISVVLQLAAAVVALRLIKLTGRKAAWLLIATAVSLMAVRRLITLVHVVSTGDNFSPDLFAEFVALLISTLMLVGLAVIGPLFRSIRTSEESARQSETRFRELFEESPIAILELDLSASKQHLAELEARGVVELNVEPEGGGELETTLLRLIQFHRVNRTALELLGVDDAGELAERINAIADGPLLPSFDKVMQQLAQGMSTVENETEFVNFAGQRRHIIIRLSVPPGHRDSLSRVLVTISDMTERHDMQARLVVSDRMASVGTLAAGVAHEINNPLTFVMGNLSLLERTVSDTVSKSYVADALQGTERVRDIVRDMQVLTRAEQGKLAQVNVQSALDPAVRMATSQIRPRARLVITPMDSLSAWSNESRLTQVLLNLLVNAAQAIPAGDVEHNEIRVSASASDGQVRISIRDTGSGIPKAALPRIFEPFFTTKGPGSGTGLGLYICHNMITEMGGDLRVVRSDETGTEFCLSLPQSAPASIEAAAEPSRNEEPKSKRRRILVIDDEAAIRSLVPNLLEHDEVITAGSGREGIAMLESETFDLILCDLIMTDLTGMDVYDYVERERPKDVQRLFFMSGGVFTERSREFLAGVSNPCISKPFSREELQSFIDQARPESA